MIARAAGVAATFLVCAGAAIALPPDTLFTRTYGGINIDVAYDARQTGDGGFVLTGYTRSYGSAGHDLWLLKTDPVGNEVWNWHFGGSEDDEGQAVWQTRDGGYVAAGFTLSFGAGGKDVWLVKADSSGNEDWTRTFGGAHDDEAYAIQETIDGGLIIAGATSSFGAGGRDMWLIKTDESGATAWSRTLGGYGSDGAWSVSQTSDKGFILAGWTFSSGPGYFGNAWLVKTDSLGYVEWDEVFGGDDADRGYDARETADGGYIMAGYTGSSGAGLYDLLLVKTDAGGTQEWSEAFGGTGRDYGNAVVQTADGGYLAAGYTLSYGAGGDDVYLVRTDAEGNLEWQTTYGGSASDVAYALVNTADDGYAVAGHTLSFGAGLHDGWLIRLAAEGPPAGVLPLSTPARVVLDVQPNPFSQTATISYAVPTATKVRLCIHDPSGRRVRTMEQGFSQAGYLPWDGRDAHGNALSAGIYVVHLIADSQESSQRLVLLK